MPKSQWHLPHRHSESESEGESERGRKDAGACPCAHRGTWPRTFPLHLHSSLSLLPSCQRARQRCTAGPRAPRQPAPRAPLWPATFGLEPPVKASHRRTPARSEPWTGRPPAPGEAGTARATADVATRHRAGAAGDLSLHTRAARAPKTLRRGRRPRPRNARSIYGAACYSDGAAREKKLNCRSGVAARTLRCEPGSSQIARMARGTSRRWAEQGDEEGHPDARAGTGTCPYEHARQARSEPRVHAAFSCPRPPEPGTRNRPPLCGRRVPTLCLAAVVRNAASCRRVAQAGTTAAG